jgi:hypothetical protein
MGLAQALGRPGSRWFWGLLETRAVVACVWVVWAVRVEVVGVNNERKQEEGPKPSGQAVRRPSRSPRTSFWAREAVKVGPRDAIDPSSGLQTHDKALWRGAAPAEGPGRQESLPGTSRAAALHLGGLARRAPQKASDTFICPLAATRPRSTRLREGSAHAWGAPFLICARARARPGAAQRGVPHGPPGTPPSNPIGGQHTLRGARRGARLVDVPYPPATLSPPATHLTMRAGRHSPGAPRDPGVAPAPPPPPLNAAHVQHVHAAWGFSAHARLPVVSERGGSPTTGAQGNIVLTFCGRPPHAPAAPGPGLLTQTTRQGPAGTPEQHPPRLAQALAAVTAAALVAPALLHVLRRAQHHCGGHAAWRGRSTGVITHVGGWEGRERPAAVARRFLLPLANCMRCAAMSAHAPGGRARCARGSARGCREREAPCPCCRGGGSCAALRGSWGLRSQ